MERLDYQAPVIFQGNDIWWGYRHLRLGEDIEFEAIWKLTGLTIGIYAKSELGGEFYRNVSKCDLIEIISEWIMRNRFSIGLQVKTAAPNHGL